MKTQKFWIEICEVSNRITIGFQGANLRFVAIIRSIYMTWMIQMVVYFLSPCSPPLIHHHHHDYYYLVKMMLFE